MEEGLRAAGFTVTTDYWLRRYGHIRENARREPYQMLAAFAKTGVIEAGGSEKIGLHFDMKDIASYDEETEQCRIFCANFC